MKFLLLNWMLSDSLLSIWSEVTISHELIYILLRHLRNLLLPVHQIQSA